jgi:hypothetical protein
MRIKKNKRLGLNKTTVANLNADEMRAVYAGGEDQLVQGPAIPISSSSIGPPSSTYSEIPSQVAQDPIPISTSTTDVKVYPA